MPDLSTQYTDGGQKTGAVAASGSGDVVISAKPGRLCKLLVTTAGSAALEIYDNATTSSSAQLIWKSAAVTVLGEQFTLDIPVANGIVVKRATNTPAVTVSYVEDQVSGTGLGRGRTFSKGGHYTSTHAAGAGGAAAASAVPGRLCRVVVLAQGTAATHIYDNASAATGTILWSVPASGTTAVAAGTVFDVQLPAANGIYVGGATNTSQLLVTYSKDNPNGR